LLASAGFEGQPVKGVYFFPGERGKNAEWYTTHPLDPRDERWNSDTSTRPWVMDRMVQAHVNTVVMSYWSNMPQWSPMEIDPTTLGGVLDAVQGRPLVVLPAIEGRKDLEHPEIPHWEFADEFPAAHAGLVERVGDLVALFANRMDLWARLYDRTGRPRFAVNILHVASRVLNGADPATDDRRFAAAFDAAADEVEHQFHIPVGFTLDAVGGPGFSYSPDPRRVGRLLEQTAAVLAVQGFASEVFSQLVKSNGPCPSGDWRSCPAYDNNLDNLEALADWKRDAVRDWVGTGAPVILDVSNGFDGRIVWTLLDKVAGGFWGDNLDYTDDRWRNWLSQLKGPGVRGITFDCWNGYTEGYAAVPSREHGGTVYAWLTDLLEPPPWDYSHMHYVNGARTHRVYGAICEKWIRLGADRGFGAPVSEELPSALGRMQHFTDGKAIYWSGATGAYEVHGVIGRTYREEGGDASRLGLPVSDEQPNGGGAFSLFQNGRIDWAPGDVRGRISSW
jgi:hypothetical protein